MAGRTREETRFVRFAPVHALLQAPVDDASQPPVQDGRRPGERSGRGNRNQVDVEILERSRSNLDVAQAFLKPVGCAQERWSIGTSLAVLTVARGCVTKGASAEHGVGRGGQKSIPQLIGRERREESDGQGGSSLRLARIREAHEDHGLAVLLRGRLVRIGPVYVA